MPSSTPILRRTASVDVGASARSRAVGARFAERIAERNFVQRIMAGHTASTPSGAGPTGPDGDALDRGSADSSAESSAGASAGPAPRSPGGSPDGVSLSQDPIFQGEEVEERPTRRSTLLFQFFLFPLLIVVASVGVFLFFGAIGGSQKSAQEFLADIRSGGENVQKQAAQQLATILQRERARVDAKEITLAQAEYSTGAFRRDLVAAFEDAFLGKTLDRQAFLASALGLVGDPAFLPTLAKRSAPPTPPEIRRAVARAISLLDTAEGAPILVRLLTDSDEPVRNQAVEGLTRARNRTPEALTALRQALQDESEYVRVNAAAALALAGDSSGIDLVGKLLDPAYADEVARRRIPGFTTEEMDGPAIAAMRQFTLASGLKAALALRAEALKPRVEALRAHSDKSVRDLAQQVLDRWGSPK